MYKNKTLKYEIASAASAAAPAPTAPAPAEHPTT